jgi:hypothetical protein
MQLDARGATDLLRLPLREVEGLACRGRIGPAISRGHGGELVGRVASGLKPATLKVSAAAAEYALDLGLVVRAVESCASGRIVDLDPWPEATGEFAPDHPRNEECVLYAAAVTPEAMDRLEAAYRASIQSGVEALRGGVELGFALGYSAADVAAWLLNTRRLARRDVAATP